MMKLLIGTIVLSVFTLVSCKDAPTAERLPQEEKVDIIEADSSDSTKVEVDSLPQRRYTLLNDSAIGNGLLMLRGVYHAEEFDSSFIDLNWMCLSKKDDHYSLVETTLDVERNFDELVDDSGDTTGWSIGMSSSSIESENYFLSIEGLTKSDRVPFVVTDEKEFEPGDSLEFEFLGRNYIIWGEAEESKAESKEYGYPVWKNYKLVLSMENDSIQELYQLGTSNYIQENMMNVLFIGDINSDGVLDLIIDCSTHYNSVKPTLYLSDPTDVDAPLKVRALHESYGC